MGFPAANDYANASTQGAKKTAVESFLAATKRLPGGNDEENVEILSGAYTPTRCSAKLDTEGGAASDDLDTPVWTNIDEGMFLITRCTSAARPIRVRHNTGAGPGKFQTADGQHLLLDDPDEFVVWQRDGNDAREVLRSTPSRLARTQTVTADRTLVPSDCGKTFENTGAAGLVNLSLTALPVGFWFRMVVLAAQNFRATRDTGEEIREGSGITTTGHIQSNVVGDVVLIQKVTATLWVVMSESPGAAWAVT